MKQWSRFLILFCAICCATISAKAQTTAVTANFKDLTGAVVTSGSVSFSLRPGIDTTISGDSRFTPQTVICVIVGTAAAALTRSSNVVTANGITNAGLYASGEYIDVQGESDSSFNGIFQITSVNAGAFQVIWGQAAGNSSATGGSIATLNGSGPGCQITQNSALVPPGTYYSVGVAPYGATTTQFNFYALGAGPVDLSTVVPTPSEMPAYSFVDTFSSQTIGGTKTFTGLITFNGGISGSGSLGAFTLGTGATNTVNSWVAIQNFTAVVSLSSNPAQSGFTRLAAGDSVSWRNSANTTDLPISKNASDQLSFNGSLFTAAFGASGGSHSVGLVPDPGATPGDPLRSLREDSTWHAATPHPLDTTSFTWTDDFTAPWAMSGSTAPWDLFAAAGGTEATTPSVWPHIGLILLSTSAGSGGTASIQTPNTGDVGQLGANVGWEAKWTFKLTQTTSEYFYCGFESAGGSITPPSATFIGIRYDTSLSDTTFIYEVQNTVPTSSETISAAVDTNWHVLDMQSSSAGTINFTLDGTHAGVISSNVPTGVLEPYCGIKNTTTVNDAVTLDEFTLAITGLAR